LAAAEITAVYSTVYSFVLASSLITAASASFTSRPR